jgi:hypothetical protein
MATLNLNWFFWFRKKDKPPFENSREAYKFARRVYTETKGPTPELKTLYKRYRANQDSVARDREAENSAA